MELLQAAAANIEALGDLTNELSQEKVTARVTTKKKGKPYRVAREVAMWRGRRRTCGVVQCWTKCEECFVPG